MAIRFRRSIKLAPGVRWNVSGSGSSWTLGPRGATVGIGKRGTFLNSSLPGTGLVSRSQLSGGTQTSRTPSVAPTASSKVQLTCAIDDHGRLTFHDAEGSPLAEHVVDLAKKQNRDAILGLIAQKCDQINEQVESLARLHHDTPDSRRPPKLDVPVFDRSRPASPPPLKVTWIDRIIPGRRRRLETKAEDEETRHKDRIREWGAARAEHELLRQKRKDLIETRIYDDVEAMQDFLEERLNEIVWPRETDVSLEVRNDGRLVLVDADLPEVEDMPTKLAAVPARGLKLSVKELSATKVQRLYVDHVHGVIFRLVGEAFAALPKAEAVIASGYSQRRDKATGALADDYLLSVRVMRQQWLEGVAIDGLSAIDPVQALACFDLVRDMNKSGALKAITPHTE